MQRHVAHGDGIHVQVWVGSWTSKGIFHSLASSGVQRWGQSCPWHCCCRLEDDSMSSGLSPAPACSIPPACPSTARDPKPLGC